MSLYNLDDDLASYRQIRQTDIPEIRALHDSSFPLTYADDFYRSLLSSNSCCVVATAPSSSSHSRDASSSSGGENRSHADAPRLIGVCTARAGNSDETQCCCLAAPRRVGYVMTLSVDVEWRRKGVGRRLMLITEDILQQQHGCEVISLHTQCSNSAAKSFYESIGYVKRARMHGYYTNVTRGSLDAYRYEKIYGGGGEEPEKRRGCVRSALAFLFRPMVSCRDAVAELLVDACTIDYSLAERVSTLCIVPAFVVCSCGCLFLFLILVIVLMFRV